MANAAALPPGTVLSGTYHILRLIGAGGMGAVYEAANARLGNQRVAVKVLHAEIAQHPEAFARFRREAEIGALLNHPNIIYVTDSGKLPDGTPFLVMEMLVGEDLDARLRRGPIARDAAMRILRDVASALTAAHKQGVVHRDLKPQNIFLSQGPGGVDHVKVLDFGISKLASATTVLTREATVLGTPQYMSPEQALGKSSEIDPRTDQFALATIAYELFAGKPAFIAENITAVLFKIVYESPPPLAAIAPGLPLHVVDAIARGMAKPKDERFPDMLSFVHALEAGPTTLSMPGKRGRAMPIALGVGVMGVVAATLVALHSSTGTATMPPVGVKTAADPLPVLTMDAHAPVLEDAAVIVASPPDAKPVIPPKPDAAPVLRPPPTPMGGQQKTVARVPGARDVPDRAYVEELVTPYWRQHYPREVVSQVKQGGLPVRLDDGRCFTILTIFVRHQNGAFAQANSRIWFAPIDPGTKHWQIVKVELGPYKDTDAATAVLPELPTTETVESATRRYWERNYPEELVYEVKAVGAPVRDGTHAQVMVAVLIRREDRTFARAEADVQFSPPSNKAPGADWKLVQVVSTQYTNTGAVDDTPPSPLDSEAAAMLKRAWSAMRPDLDVHSVVVLGKREYLAGSQPHYLKYRIDLDVTGKTAGPLTVGKRYLCEPEPDSSILKPHGRNWQVDEQSIAAFKTERTNCKPH